MFICTRVHTRREESVVFIQTMGRDVSRDKKPNLFHILINLPKDKMEIKFVLGKKTKPGGWASPRDVW